MTAASRARLLSIGILAVVFASGIVVGFAWDRRLDAAEAEVLTERADSAAADSRAEEPGVDRQGEGRRYRFLWERVDPTDPQRVQLDSIMQVYWQASREFHKESRQAYDEGMRSLVVETRDAIRAVLSPEQAIRYDSLATAADERRRRDDDGGDRTEGN